jgi:hypothetical protein
VRSGMQYTMGIKTVGTGELVSACVRTKAPQRESFCVVWWWW